MDAVKSINMLRSSFLRGSFDEGLAKRIIKPYVPDFEEQGEIPLELRDLYRLDDGADLLDTLESPSISENYMAEIELLQRARFQQKIPSAKDPRFKEGARPNLKAGARDRRQKVSGVSQTAERHTLLNKSKAENLHGQVPALDKKVDVNVGEGPVTSLTTSISRGQHDSKGKRKALSFSRIFKPQNNQGTVDEFRRPSATSVEIKTTDSHQPIGKQSKDLGFYDGAFNYDEILEDDEDDEDDDEDDLEQNDGFFLGGLPKSPESKQNKPAKLGNFPRYAQNFLSVSDENNNPVLAGLDGKVSNQTPDTETIKSASRKEDVSDLDSYMDENDLRELDLEDKGHSNDVTHNTYLRHISSTDFINGSNNLVSSSNSYVASNASSYGQSLLDSEIEELETQSLCHERSSVLDDSLLADELFISESLPGHSIPRSHAFKYMDGNQQAPFSSQSPSLNSDADKLKDQSFSISFTARRSDQFGASKKGIVNPRSLSNSTTKAIRGLHRTASSTGPTNSMKENIRHKRSASDSKSQGKFSKTNFDLSVFKKVEPSKSDPPTASQLTNIFKQKESQSSNPLAYFSFVSGDQVPKSESMNLYVYIQDSIEYRSEPINVGVRKSSSTFEVIGFILYQYSTRYKSDCDRSGLSPEELIKPNMFVLKIVDEDGEPFEDNFGTVERKKPIGNLFDNEVVLCKVKSQKEFDDNELLTPNPNLDLQVEFLPVDALATKKGTTDASINQLSYYKPILKEQSIFLQEEKESIKANIRVFLFPNTNPEFNFTTLHVSVSTSLDAILLQYCSMKSMKPSDYALKLSGKNVVANLEDSVGELDGNYDLELISIKQVKALGLKKMKTSTFGKPTLPTIQSADLTPDTGGQNRFLAAVDPLKMNSDERHPNNKRSGISPNKRSLAKEKPMSSKLSQLNEPTAGGGGFFKLKNSSKSSLRGGRRASYTDRSGINLDPSFNDAITGAYYKYRVWRRQQMSFINKHERTLAIDGDYLYIIPPENGFNRHHETAKTKCFHLSQVVLIQKSNRVPEYFKIFVNRSAGLKRYYFEAVSDAECEELVSRVNSLLSAYKMDHKGSIH
ncbi:LADA_0F05600g1_1 [Lachancea dasiensis]|uniref:LADA_0F05600g1_1 n=1 Tax=Lachancea dasiensis TaxID=1072105 RepID=A0A1G4JJQ1_9SACH|nr:LADA_0F05600g1_1 [Lachancea dasiensis]